MPQSPSWADAYIAEQWRNFGREVERRRLALGWTQEVAAQKIDKRRQAWQRIEKGQSTTRKTVLLVANALGWNPEEALNMAGFSPPPEQSEKKETPALYRTVTHEERNLNKVEWFLRMGSQIEELTQEEQELFIPILKQVAENVERRVEMHKK